MKKLLFLIAAIIPLACKEKPVEVTQYSIEQFSDNVSIWGSSLSADETRILATSDETGIFNVYSLPFDGSEKEQLTFSEKESFMAISWFPEDDRFLYSADQGGNEVSHIYLQDLDGSVTDLTPWEGAVSRFSGWTRDKTAFHFNSNKRDPRYFDLYKMNIEDFSFELVYENNEGYNPSAISKSGRYIALVKSITTDNNEMYLLDQESGEVKHISEHEGDAIFSPSYFTLDESKLIYRTNEGMEFMSVAIYDLASGQKEIIYESNWDVNYVYTSYNETYQVMGINEDARNVIVFTEQVSGEQVKLPDLGELNVSGVGISESEEKLLISAGSATSPTDLYAHTLGTDELVRLTNRLNSEINENDLVAAEVIRYASFDGLEIPAILYKPKQATAKNKVPVMLWIHGGPGGQSTTWFNSYLQYFVNHGYGVLMVNNRGSSGYGKTFYSLDNQRHGEDDLMDCVKAKDYLATLKWVDQEKIGIMGGSYGGYMTMAALTFHPEEFAVGVNIFGVTNWLRTLRSIPPYWESFREALYSELGDPTKEDSIRLHKISPLFHAHNVTKPLMVIQGANDVRVLKVESDEIVEAVKANGVPVEYIVFEDEGHGFLKQENQIKAYGDIKRFLDIQLKGIVQEQ